ncbi:MAG: lytic murein transglycosylase B [Pseudomonadales bacterium]
MKFNKIVARVIILMAVVLPIQSWANEAKGISYEKHPEALKLIDEMVVEHAFDRQVLLDVFAQAQFKESIIQLMDAPAEGKPWKDYRPIFVTAKRAKGGREFMASHRETLLRAEQKFGVPAEIIVAIIGVETRYGKHAGRTRVLDALSTLAFDYPRRSTFFRKELKAFLLLTRDEQMNPQSLKGSYAGAMGYGQFMPSSFLEYAIDFDGDGRKDIWQNPVDAIGSVANYFARHGWKNNEQVVSRARFSGNGNDVTWVKGRRNLKPVSSVSQLIALGLQPQSEIDAEQLATAMRLTGPKGKEYWLGLHNFYVITRYNHSALYAMSVYQLSQKIAK